MSSSLAKVTSPWQGEMKKARKIPGFSGGIASEAIPDVQLID